MNDDDTVKIVVLFESDGGVMRHSRLFSRKDVRNARDPRTWLEYELHQAAKPLIDALVTPTALEGNRANV